MRNRFKSTILAAALAIAAPLLAAPAADASTEAVAARSTFFAGSIWTDNWAGGAKNDINFVNAGSCDSYGYTRWMTNQAPYLDAQASSWKFSGTNGCNRSKIRGKNGITYYFSTANYLYNFPASLNDAVLWVNVYHA